jgi:hypothetical protein
MDHFFGGHAAAAVALTVDDDDAAPSLYLAGEVVDPLYSPLLFINCYADMNVESFC